MVAAIIITVVVISLIVSPMVQFCHTLIHFPQSSPRVIFIKIKSKHVICLLTIPRLSGPSLISLACRLGLFKAGRLLAHQPLQVQVRKPLVTTLPWATAHAGHTEGTLSSAKTSLMALHCGFYNHSPCGQSFIFFCCCGKIHMT